ncbi:hypothetical protein EU803_14970 [Loktanella sp. IMCC34160]|uniref:hypothetical protein n=1 Tax=Loktanella sp. IMCC34160 TaxID=2510646 RepID=UPI00101D37BD|nr:hypothetical protein [Loktanella sp. IMCC34160]RYG89923.1 hypothetical protein EU803_14970 [Loktanella sp. IMCC34160]
MTKIMRAGLSAAFALIGGAAMAAGTGTGIEAGFTEVGTDLQTLLGGAGGFLIVIISIALAAIMLAVGRGWGQAIIAFAVALFLGYGVTALQGISGVTATTDLLAVETLAIEADPSL